LGVVDVVGVSPGSRIGETGPARLPAAYGPAFGDATERLETFSIDANEAIAAGITPPAVEGNTITQLEQVATIPLFLTALEGFDASAPEAARFVQLPLTSQFFHTMASPEVTYLLLIGGLGLLVFELFTAGVGIAGLIGSFCLAFGCYGLNTLPFRTIGVVLIVVGIAAMAVDIQVNLPRAYTMVGLILFILGTFLIWDGVTMSWVTGATGIVGAALYGYIGMPTMVRTRFSSPVIGRKWLVGKDGEALSAIDSDGSIEILGAAWPARSEEGVGVGQAARVVGVEQVTLLVEPI
jgi:membrane-bound serine protease (ClpP class)